MPIPVAVLVALFTVVYGVVCIRYPIVVLRTMARWPRFVFTHLLSGIRIHEALQDAIDLIDNPTRGVPGSLKSAVAIIRGTGIIACLVAIVYSCIIVAIVSQR